MKRKGHKNRWGWDCRGFSTLDSPAAAAAAFDSAGHIKGLPVAVRTAQYPAAGFEEDASKHS